MKLKQPYWIISILLIVIIFSGTTTAQILIPVSKKAEEKAKAPEKSLVIERREDHFILRPPGLEKKTFIHYVKPATECGNGICEPGEKKDCPADCEFNETDSTCYDVFGTSVKWENLPINYIINPLNLDNLSVDFIINAISSGTKEWDSQTKNSIFGDHSIDYRATWDIDAPDGRNEIVFGYFPEEGTIAVTGVWGYFSGPPAIRKIIEFDIMFNITYIWGNAVADSTVMDLQNIATHELGHAIGLADLYETTCPEETMYGYSVEGEMKKRDLNDGDITGIQKIYGK